MHKYVQYTVGQTQARGPVVTNIFLRSSVPCFSYYVYCANLIIQRK